MSQKKVPIGLTENQYNRLKKIEHETGNSMAATIRTALKQYFSREEAFDDS